ncbi:MAG: hypothetical protein GX640_22750 [Fibrobacter sp.]|nr:hypothetical protein [Fibrobacter sp.]
MAILWELFPVFVAIYLIECISFVRDGTLLFIPRIFRYLPYLNHAGFGIGAISPSSMTFYSIDSQLLFTSKGFYYPDDEYVAEFPFSPLSRYRFCSYEDIQTLKTEERDLLLNKKVILRTQSPKTSRAIYDSIKQFAARPIPGNDSAFKDSFRRDLLKSRINAVKKNSSILSLTGNTFFVLLFIALPLWFLFNEKLYLPTAVYITYFASIILLWIGGLTAYSVCSKRLYGKTDWMSTLQFVFCPVSICHLTAYFGKYSLLNFNPFTMASVLLPRKDFLAFARKKYAVINAQLRASPPEHLAEILRITKEEYERIAGETGFSLEDLKAVPGNRDRFTKEFCPVCLSEFQRPVKNCPNCTIETEKWDNSLIAHR